MGVTAISFISSLSAATTLVSGGAINGNTASDWDNGAPSGTNEGTITVDGQLTVSVFSYSGITTVTHSAGNIVATGTNGLNFNGGDDTWNMTGGTFTARYFNANSSTFNLSGGTLILTGVGGTSNIQTSNNGTINLSGSFSVNGANSNAAPSGSSTGGGSYTFNFDSGWTGSWLQGNFSGTQWRDLITGDSAYKLDGVAIDGAAFDSNFLVTDGGSTLTIVPEPSSTALLGLGGLAFLVRRRR